MRPQFHFTARTGWINDPHGITVKDGEYHAFFQYVPDRTAWAPSCHWGHATGPDLLSLTELPVALVPGDGDDGIWTGALVRDESGAARIFYTSTVHPDLGLGRVRTATPLDEDWIRWQKGGIVAEAPEELDVVAYRDPFLVQEDDGWHMFVAAGLLDGTAAALSYRSNDFDSWEYEGIALQRSTLERDPWMGALWECPQIVEVDGRHVMVSSIWEADVLHHAGYAIGRYAHGRFDAEAWGRLSFGPSYYAPSFFRDPDGRPCLTFWMRGVTDLEAGWASAHSVPHLLSLRGDTLVAAPHPDLEKYRAGPAESGALPALAGDVLWAPDPGAELTVLAGAGEHLVLTVGGDGIQVRSAVGTWSVPRFAGPVRLVLDAQTVELSTDSGVLGLALLPGGDRFSITSTGGDLTVFPLTREG